MRGGTRKGDGFPGGFPRGHDCPDTPESCEALNADGRTWNLESDFWVTRMR